jgi:hypothetical protein
LFSFLGFLFGFPGFLFGFPPIILCQELYNWKKNKFLKNIRASNYENHIALYLSYRISHVYYLFFYSKPIRSPPRTNRTWSRIIRTRCVNHSARTTCQTTTTARATTCATMARRPRWAAMRSSCSIAIQLSARSSRSCFAATGRLISPIEINV